MEHRAFKEKEKKFVEMDHQNKTKMENLRKLTFPPHLKVVNTKQTNQFSSIIWLNKGVPKQIPVMVYGHNWIYGF